MTIHELTIAALLTLAHGCTTFRVPDVRSGDLLRTSDGKLHCVVVANPNSQYRGDVPVLLCEPMKEIKE